MVHPGVVCHKALCFDSYAKPFVFNSELFPYYAELFACHSGRREESPIPTNNYILRFNIEG